MKHCILLYTTIISTIRYHQVATWCGLGNTCYPNHTILLLSGFGTGSQEREELWAKKKNKIIFIFLHSGSYRLRTFLRLRLHLDIVSVPPFNKTTQWLSPTSLPDTKPATAATCSARFCPPENALLYLQTFTRFFLWFPDVICQFCVVLCCVVFVPN